VETMWGEQGPKRTQTNETVRGIGEKGCRGYEPMKGNNTSDRNTRGWSNYEKKKRKRSKKIGRERGITLPVFGWCSHKETEKKQQKDDTLQHRPRDAKKHWGSGRNARKVKKNGSQARRFKRTLS